MRAHEVAQLFYQLLHRVLGEYFNCTLSESDERLWIITVNFTFSWKIWSYSGTRQYGQQRALKIWLY